MKSSLHKTGLCITTNTVHIFKYVLPTRGSAELISSLTSDNYKRTIVEKIVMVSLLRRRSKQKHCEDDDDLSNNHNDI